MYIDISTEEKKQEFLLLLSGFKRKGDIFKYYQVSDNTKNTRYLNNILQTLGINNEFFSKKRKEKKFCLKCGKELKYGQHKFCSNSCSASYNNKNREYSEEVKQKIRVGVLLSMGITDIETHRNASTEKKCGYCGRMFTTAKKHQKFCCQECSRRNRRLQEIKNKDERDIYKSQTKFNFSLNAYPDEFDFSLIKENGWYQATNHGDNLHGISRDHMFSVDEGYKQNIDPYLISHPANCKLMKHEDNFKKKTECSITLNELKQRVNDWNKKYGVYENKIDYTKLEKFKEMHGSNPASSTTNNNVKQ